MSNMSLPKSGDVFNLESNPSPPSVPSSLRSGWLHSIGTFTLPARLLRFVLCGPWGSDSLACARIPWPVGFGFPWPVGFGFPSPWGSDSRGLGGSPPARRGLPEKSVALLSGHAPVSERCSRLSAGYLPASEWRARAISKTTKEAPDPPQKGVDAWA